jgi:hypothetical protein
VPISDIDESDVASRLTRDVGATLGAGHRHVITSAARHCRQFHEDYASYVERVVGDVQQYFHDLFIDTTWPACPFHPNHPMWFLDGWWQADGQPVAKLGDLGEWLESSRADDLK